VHLAAGTEGTRQSSGRIYSGGTSHTSCAIYTSNRLYISDAIYSCNRLHTSDAIYVSGTIPTNSPIAIQRLNPPRSLQRPRAENHDGGRAHPCHFSPGTTSSEKYGDAIGSTSASGTMR
jgi:hypothetical protein